MARIRTIKPEFWCDEKLSPLSAIDRLTFLGLISMADDYGRVHDNAKIINAFVFPNTEDCVRESLANLSRIARINRGIGSSGMKIIEIVNWDKHQRVDKPQPKLALPAICEEKQEKTRKKKVVANHSGTVRELVAPLTTDPDPDLRPRPSICSEPAIANSKPEDCRFPVFPTSGKIREWQAEQFTLDAWQAAYPGIDITEQHRRAHVWIMANIEKRKTVSGMPKFLNRWFSKAQDDLSRFRGKPPPRHNGSELSPEELAAEEKRRYHEMMAKAAK